MHQDSFDFPLEPIVYWEASDVFSLCQEAEAALPTQLWNAFQETRECPAAPTLWLLKDRGVYLKTTTFKTSTPLHAKGCGPAAGNLEHICAIFGDKDFVAPLPCADIRTLWAESVADLRNADVHPLPQASQYLFQVECDTQTIEIGFCGK